MQYDVIVIGSGPGGYVAAIRSAQLGLKTAVVERAEPGGICLNWGCIPTKALLKSAEVFKYLKHADQYGVKIDGDITADLQAFVDRSRDVAATMSKGVQFLLKKNKVDIIEGFGILKTNKCVEVTTSEGSVDSFMANHIVLATGARPRELPTLPHDGVKIITSRQAMVLEKQPEHLLVVGSGAIGAEFAYFYNTIGTKVTLVEYMPNILPLEDIDVSKQIERSFKKAGMKVMTSSSVESVDTSGEKCVVKIQGKKKAVEVECDLVLSAVGIATNIERIGLEEAGVAVENGKVLVDDFYATNVEGVYAIGDIVHGPALAHVASHEAIICIEKIAGLTPHALNYNHIPGCTYTVPEVASVGLTEAKALEMGFELKVGKFPFTASGKATAAGARDGFVKVIFDAKTDLLLGAHMVGANVTEMISEAVLACEKSATGGEILSSVHPHPTMSEAFMEAVAQAYGTCIHL